MQAAEVTPGRTFAVRFDHGEATSELRPHIHVSVGLKTHSASGYTSHLLGATGQFLTEMYVVEFADPTWSRSRRPDLYDVPLLTFDT